MTTRTIPRIDEQDLILIACLEKNGRATCTELAEQLNASMATVRRRLRRLLDEELIQVVAVVNPMHLGYRTVASIGLNVVPSKVDVLAERLSQLSNVHFVSVCIGRYDVILWTLFREPDELNTFLRDELNGLPGITRIETNIHMDIKKRTFRYLDPRTTQPTEKA